ncbi:hypothetical protein ACWCY6_12490 [Streptomyces sp. 900105755]|uniref:hypothetical protein n=1 Tax=Streptomyces sp. NPDC056683 TaxID=3345910 RepID=UPI0036775FE0
MPDTGLLVIDMRPALLKDAHDGEARVAPVAKFADRARATGVPVFYQTAAKSRSHCCRLPARNVPTETSANDQVPVAFSAPTATTAPNGANSSRRAYLTRRWRPRG